MTSIRYLYVPVDDCINASSCDGRNPSGMVTILSCCVHCVLVTTRPRMCTTFPILRTCGVLPPITDIPYPREQLTHPVSCNLLFKYVVYICIFIIISLIFLNKKNTHNENLCVFPLNLVMRIELIIAPFHLLKGHMCRISSFFLWFLIPRVSKVIRYKSLNPLILLGLRNGAYGT